MFRKTSLLVTLLLLIGVPSRAEERKLRVVTSLSTYAAIAKEVMKAQADMVKEAVRGEENQGANPNGRPRG